MKKINKFLALMLAGFSCLTTLSACGGADGVKIDPTKTQLYVSNYDAGIGRTWIISAGTAFEEKFANYSFESGKTGVQVIYNHNRTMTGATLQSSIAKSTDNIFFTEGVDYPALVTNDLIYDVTDVLGAGAITGVTESGEFTRETATIESKIDEAMLSFLGRDGYYAAPFYLAAKSAVYDKELWNTKYYYFAKNVAPSETIVNAVKNGTDLDEAKAAYEAQVAAINAGANLFLVNEAGVEKTTQIELGLSAGPDGQYNTVDDGLPATLDEFYILMDAIADSNVIPLIYTGKFPGYADMLTMAIFGMHEGAENLGVYYSLNGTVDNLVKLDANGNVVKENGKIVTESYTFNGGEEDGYEIQRLDGKYYALQFADKVAMNSRWLAPDCDNTAISHISAQSKFLTSCLSGNTRIAMLADGAWWQQESDQTFATMAKMDAKYSRQNRNMALFTVPNATVDRFAERVETKEKNVVIAMNDSYCFINNNLAESSPQLKVAKAFFSFIHSDALMSDFAVCTGMKRGLEYEIDSEYYAKLSVYGKNVVEYMNASTVVYPYSNNSLFHKNYGYLANTLQGWNFRTKTFGTNAIEVQAPISSLRIEENRKGGLNGETYFSGLYNYYKNTVWDRLI